MDLNYLVVLKLKIQVLFAQKQTANKSPQSRRIIGHVNIGIIFYCIGNSQWCLYNTQSKSELSQEYCKLIFWHWKIMRRQLWTLICLIDGNSLLFNVCQKLRFSSVAIQLSYLHNLCDILGWGHKFNQKQPQLRIVHKLAFHKQPPHPKQTKVNLILSLP